MGKGSVQLLLGPSSGLRKVVPDGKQMFRPRGSACGARQPAVVESTGEMGGPCRHAPGELDKSLDFWRSQALMTGASIWVYNLVVGRIWVTSGYWCWLHSAIRTCRPSQILLSAATAITSVSGIGSSLRCLLAQKFCKSQHSGGISGVQPGLSIHRFSPPHPPHSPSCFCSTCTAYGAMLDCSRICSQGNVVIHEESFLSGENLVLQIVSHILGSDGSEVSLVAGGPIPIYLMACWDMIWAFLKSRRDISGGA